MVHGILRAWIVSGPRGMYEAGRETVVEALLEPRTTVSVAWVPSGEGPRMTE